MGPFIVVAHLRTTATTTTRIDFACRARALKYAELRLRDPDVRRIEVTHDHQIVWAGGEVITQTT